MARSTLRYVLPFAGLLLMASPAAAGESFDARDRQTALECASLVRARDRSGRSDFDAYVSGLNQDKLAYFGTDAESFHFEKCLTERGLFLVPVKPKVQS